MTAEPEAEWPVTRLAQVSGVSAAHFSRMFKKAFGIPPHRYLLTMRIATAKALLRETDRGITDVALASGWQSLGSFGRTFRDVVGQSPREYRTTAKLDDASLALVPACFQQAAQRPDLRIAVLEKRRQDTPG